MWLDELVWIELHSLEITKIVQYLAEILNDIPFIQWSSRIVLPQDVQTCLVQVQLLDFM